MNKDGTVILSEAKNLVICIIIELQNSSVAEFTLSGANVLLQKVAAVIASLRSQ
jgi:hypothetical protein